MPRTEIMKLTARGFSFNVRFLKAPECKAEPKSDILAAIGGLKGEVRGMFSQQNQEFSELKKSLHGELDFLRSEQKWASDEMSHKQNRILEEQDRIWYRQDDILDKQEDILVKQRHIANEQDDMREQYYRMQDEMQRQHDELQSQIVELQQWQQQKDQKKTHEAVSSKDRPAKTGRTPEKQVVLKPKEKAERQPDKKPEPEKKIESKPEKEPEKTSSSSRASTIKGGRPPVPEEDIRPVKKSKTVARERSPSEHCPGNCNVVAVRGALECVEPSAWEYMEPSEIDNVTESLFCGVRGAVRLGLLGAVQCGVHGVAQCPPC